MFASDLDRTIIFSTRALERFSDYNAALVPIEEKRGEPVSFVTEKSYGMLEKIASSLLFVPVTTRSAEQFNRIKFPQAPKYAVTSNGACIFKNGEHLDDWREKMLLELKKYSASIDEIVSILEKDKIEVAGELRIVENLFLYYYLNEQVDDGVYEYFSRILAEKGWRTSLQGRKLYAIPLPLSKGEAVKYIQEREEIDILIGAGDSLLDHDFLQFCHHAFSPKNSELSRVIGGKKNYSITENEGVLAGEEILRSVLHIAQQHYANQASHS